MAISDKVESPPMVVDGEELLLDATRPVHDPATGEVLAHAPEATAEHANEAVAAAEKAFDRGDWSRITPGERAATLAVLADRLEVRADEYARVESRNTGKPLKLSSAFDVPLSIDNLRFFAAARNLEGKASGEYLEGHSSSIRREPLGVTAAIAPWNHPLNMAAGKVGPALAAGDPMDPDTDLGPLVSPAQRDRVHGFVERAVAAGAKLTRGGEPSGNAFHAPTVIEDAAQDSEIVTRCGLAASAWTRDVFRARRAARELQAGTVWINEHLAIGSEMPHGGVKGSGFGKDMSMYALEEHTAIKHVVFELTGAPHKAWYERCQSRAERE